MSQIDFEKLTEFTQEINELRQNFPEFAREIDKCLYDISSNRLPKCGREACQCRTLTFEEFFALRNLLFCDEEEIYELD